MTYVPTHEYDTWQEAAYTWQELVELHRHHGGSGELRELGDGRVVPDAWDPASGDPEVVAWCGEGAA